MARAAQQTDGRKTKRGTSPASLANLKGGSRKGIPNKTTALLKDAILTAATEAGGKDGLVGYLKTQAVQNPQSFLPLLGKVLPLQLTGDGGGAVRVDLTGLTPEQLKALASVKLPTDA